MALIIKLKSADFSAAGLPNIEPFVDLANMDFAFDFRSRVNRLADLTGKKTLTAYRHDIAGGVTRTPDGSVVTDASGGLGINVELGYLLTNKPMPTIPIDGTMQFSIVVVGGYSGTAFPAGKVATSASAIATLLDFGTGISSNSFSFDATKADSKIGNRIKFGSTVNGSQGSSPSQKHFLILTFNGTTWTLYNKTLNTTVVKTNTELGIVSALTPSTAHVANVVMGHYHSSSTIAADYPTLYQVGMWNRVLSASEIADQYSRSKASFGAVGI